MLIRGKIYLQAGNKIRFYPFNTNGYKKNKKRAHTHKELKIESGLLNRTMHVTCSLNV